jgi:hypothetical protein
VSDDPTGLTAGLTGDVSFEITDAMVPGHVAPSSLCSLISKMPSRRSK